MASTMTVQCPSCDTAFPVDPDKVPVGGVRTQCTVCETHFRVDRPGSEDWRGPGPADASAPEVGAVATTAPTGSFGDVVAPADATADDWPQPEQVLEAEFEAGDLPILEGTEVGPEHRDRALEEALEPSGEEVEPLEAMEAGEPEDGVTAGGAAGEFPAAEAEEDWSSTLGDDWVLEREDDTSFGDLDLEVERLDTVEESQRSVSQEDSLAGYMEGEVVLTPEEPAAAPAFQFGRRDPHEKARRLARVLVSDMITYNPDRHARALEADTLARDFEEEIDKSWAEYVEQVGQELAESTTYWRDALNEILAKGQPLF